MNDPSALPPPSDRLLRTALLSARLFADSLDPNVMIRYAGLGLMQPEAAMAVLERDLARSPVLGLKHRGDPPVRPRIPKETYTRLDVAVQKALGKVIAEDQAPTGLSAGIKGFGNALRNSLGPDPAGLHRILANGALPVPKTVHPTYFKEWSTTVPPTSGPSTLIVSEIMLKSDVRTVAMLCDPRRWSEGSLFWQETRAYDTIPSRLADLPNLNDREIRHRERATSWKGRLHERVAGLATFTVELKIDFDVTDTSCTLKYCFASSPDRLTKDDGQLTIEQTKDPDWLLARVTKYIDFEDAPFGGPSAGDIMAPNFFAAWMRIQQDIWATRIAEFAEQDQS